MKFSAYFCPWMRPWIKISGKCPCKAAPSAPGKSPQKAVLETISGKSLWKESTESSLRKCPCKESLESAPESFVSIHPCWRPAFCSDPEVASVPAAPSLLPLLPFSFSSTRLPLSTHREPQLGSPSVLSTPVSLCTHPSTLSAIWKRLTPHLVQTPMQCDMGYRPW